MEGLETDQGTDAAAIDEVAAVAAAERLTAKDEAPQVEQAAKSLLDRIAENYGVTTEDLAAELAKVVMPNKSGLLFFRCAKTCFHSCLDRNGENQYVQRRPNQPATELTQMFIEGYIYPFLSLKQLPVKAEVMIEEDEDGNPIFIDDPKAAGDPFADRIPKTRMLYDPQTGKRTTMYRRSEHNQGVAHFVETYVSPDIVQRFLRGDHNTGIINPVRAVDRDGNYTHRVDGMAGVPQSVESMVAELHGDGLAVPA